MDEQDIIIFNIKFINIQKFKLLLLLRYKNYTLKL